MSKILSIFSGTIGKKYVMALTGLLLSGFLVSHLAGNLLLLKGEAMFNEYAKMLSTNPLLPAAEVVLAAIFLGHIVTGIRLAWQNRQARPVRYEASASAGAKSPASTTMALTGLLLIVFLFVHLKTFRFIGRPESLYRHVVDSFKNPVYTGFYCLAMAGMVVHLSHGFQSAFQTLGIHHPKLTPVIKKFGYVFAVSMLGFAALTVYAYFGGMA